MSTCNAVVMANSTFSWWAAMLPRPPGPSKFVYYPARWFQPDAGLSTDDLFPPTWIRV
jgi:hypothetical protein